MYLLLMMTEDLKCARECLCVDGCSIVDTKDSNCKCALCHSAYDLWYTFHLYWVSMCEMTKI